MNSRRLLRLELKNFLASRAVIAGLLVIFLAGLYAIEHGRRVIAAQQRVISETPQMQREHQEKMIAQHASPDPANALYYINHFTTHEPSRFAPLSVGLRDVNPYNLKVRMLTLEAQLYDSDLSNPSTLALGNFDLAFLLVFLYPLLIIAFTHNTLSAEQEQGTWSLLRSQPVSPQRMLLLKAALRFAAVLGVWTVTIVVAFLWLRLPLDRRAGIVLVLSLGYLLFWFALSFFVLTFRRSSNFNALALLGVWLTVSILIPAALNVLFTILLPVPEAMDVTVNQREGYHRQWDRPKAETMRHFSQRYPEYASFKPAEEKFSWGWYYAAQHLGDEAAAASSREFRAKLLARREWMARIAWLIPTINAQGGFNEIARTDLHHHLAYLDSVRDFHEQVRRFFYPYLMRVDAPATMEWGRMPVHEFSDEANPVRFPLSILSLFALSGALFLLAGRALNQDK